MQIRLDYGRSGLSVDLPDECEVTVLRKLQDEPLPDPAGAMERALRAPVAATPLRERAAGARRACIVICDITRPVPNRLILPPLIRTLLEAGMEPDQITVLIATGLHRPNEGAELDELVGDRWVLDTVRVVNHFARAADAHADLGRTRTRGTPVKLDHRFVEADLKIVTGLVEPHFMAGYSGGRKVIAPGIAHEDTIRTFHNAEFLENPAARACNLEGNPLHEEQLEIVRMLGEVYAVNVVLDEHRRVVDVNYGGVIESHLEAVARAERSSRVAAPRKFRTVLTSSAGYPLDQTYYQTVKAMVTPLDILDDDSDLIVASDCSEGLGSSAFRESQTRLVREGEEAFLQSILGKPFADVDEWETEMQLKPMRKARLHLYSTGLPEEDRGLTGARMVDRIESAVLESVRRTGDPAVAVIPEGPYVVPYVAD